MGANRPKGLMDKGIVLYSQMKKGRCTFTATHFRFVHAYNVTGRHSEHPKCKSILTYRLTQSS